VADDAFSAEGEEEREEEEIVPAAFVERRGKETESWPVSVFSGRERKKKGKSDYTPSFRGRGKGERRRRHRSTSLGMEGKKGGGSPHRGRYLVRGPLQEEGKRGQRIALTFVMRRWGKEKGGNRPSAPSYP